MQTATTTMRMQTTTPPPMATNCQIQTVGTDEDAVIESILPVELVVMEIGVNIVGNMFVFLVENRGIVGASVAIDDSVVSTVVASIVPIVVLVSTSIKSVVGERCCGVMDVVIFAVLLILVIFACDVVGAGNSKQ